MKSLLIHWLLLLVISFTIVSAHSAELASLPTPEVVSEVLTKDPEISRAIKIAMSLWSDEKWTEATAQWEDIFSRADQKYGRDHILTELSGAYIGDCLRERSEFKSALPLLERAAIAFDRTFGPTHLHTAWALNGMAATHVRLRQFDLALPLYKRALAIREIGLGPVHPDIAQSLNGLAGTYSEMAQYEKALPIYLRALSIREKTLGPRHQKTAQSLNNLAVNYENLKQHDAAISAFLRASEINEELFGPRHRDTVSIRSNLALTYAQLGRYKEALSTYQRLLQIGEESPEPDSPHIAEITNDMAVIYTQLGEYERALQLNSRALAIRETNLGPDHLDTAQSLNNLALTNIKLGRYDRALPACLRALAIHESVLGPTHPDTAATLSNLALIYRDIAQFDKALLLNQRALAIRESALGAGHPDTAQSLNNLALTYNSLAQHDKALPLNQRALAIVVEALGSKHPQVAPFLNNLAETFFFLGEYDNALPLYEQSLQVHENGLGLAHPDNALVMFNLAMIYSKRGQFDKALLLGNQALTISETGHGFDHPITVAILHNIATNYSQIGQIDLAISIFKLVVNMRQGHRAQVARLSEDGLTGYTRSVSSSYTTLAFLLTEQGRLPEAQLVLDMLKEDEQFDFVRRSEVANPRRTRIAYNATEKSWMERYRIVSGRLAALGAEEQALQRQTPLGLSAEQKRRKQELVDDLRIAQKAFESFLHEMRVNFTRSGPARTADIAGLDVDAASGLQNLIRGLGHDAVLLQYYVTDDQVGMLLTTPGVQLARSTKVNSRELNRQIAEFRRLLREPKSALLPASQALYQLLVAPVAKDLEQAGAKTVMLSLDGALRYLPFGALHDGQRYLVQRWNLPMYTSVTKNRLRDAVTPQWQAAGLGVTRAMGEFAALPAVKAEMSSIVKTAGAGVLPGEVHLDEAFTAVRLKDVSQRSFQLLHVASHFRFSPGTEVNSFLLLGDGQQLTLGDIRTQNYRFDNVDLLTLSACDTGLGGGRDAQGREIEGFGVIAQQQGAKAVLASLWPVADQSTATLMAEMYRRRQEQKLTKTEALRQAQLSLLSQSRYAHPFYWAPFILMGNWL